MGFSIGGLVLAAMILAPSLIFVVFPPRNVPEGIGNGGTLFTVLERIGQATCILLLVVSRDSFNDATTDVWLILLAASIAFYYGLWIRYFALGREFLSAFAPIGFIPIPMAIFPVLAFGFAALWEGSVWLGIAAVVLAAGHIPNSWHTYLSVKRATAPM